MTERSDYTGKLYKQAHPEKASEYNRRSNSKRPDRDRAEKLPCGRCGSPRSARTGNKNPTGLCRSCWQEVERS